MAPNTALRCFVFPLRSWKWQPSAQTVYNIASQLEDWIMWMYSPIFVCILSTTLIIKRKGFLGFATHLQKNSSAFTSSLPNIGVPMNVRILILIHRYIIQWKIVARPVWCFLVIFQRNCLSLSGSRQTTWNIHCLQFGMYPIFLAYYFSLSTCLWPTQEYLVSASISSWTSFVNSFLLRQLREEFTV